MNKSENIPSPGEWWSSKRRHYNLGLIKAGAIAFLCYAILVWTFQTKLTNDAEITLFSTFIQGIGYLVLIGIANIFYFVGPLAESILSPSNRKNFRHRTYTTGYWMSCLIPFSAPIFVLIDLILNRNP